MAVFSLWLILYYGIPCPLWHNVPMHREYNIIRWVLTREALVDISPEGQNNDRFSVPIEFVNTWSSYFPVAWIHRRFVTCVQPGCPTVVAINSIPGHCLLNNRQLATALHQAVFGTLRFSDMPLFWILGQSFLFHLISADLSHFTKSQTCSL